MAQAALASIPNRSIELDDLAETVRTLDPGSRALLDLSVRWRIRDDAMAPVLRTDAFHLAWRRARALERVAAAVGTSQPAPLAEVRAALTRLPADVWQARPQLMPPREEPDALSRALELRPRAASLVAVQTAEASLAALLAGTPAPAEAKPPRRRFARVRRFFRRGG